MDVQHGLHGDLKLDAMSFPPHDVDGDEVPASVTVYLNGPPKGETPNLRLSFTIDEAETLAYTLMQLTTDARAGNYSEVGLELLDSMKEHALRQAWVTLMGNDGPAHGGDDEL